ncbi:MAG: cytochrome P450 [Corynebacterium sp.]|nr:cytochrome P450 [Corynebacterium sp.]
MGQKVPGPQPYPVLGTLYELNPLRFKDEASKGSERYGEYYRHVFPGEGAVTMVGSYRLVNELSDQKRFDKRVHASFREIRQFAGNGLFTADTDNLDWQKGHRILMPAFNRVALERMFRDMVDCADQLLLKWSRLPEGEIIDTQEDFTRVTLDTIALTSFSYRFNSFYSSEFHPFVNAFQRNLELTGPRALLPDLFKKLSQRSYDSNTQTAKKFVDELMADRRANPSKPGEEDLLDVMLSAMDAKTKTPLSDENIRDQLLTFLIAGHETTSSLLAFVVYRLLENPEVFAKARTHVDEVLGDRFPTYDDLQKLTYIDEIMFETLRLNPPVWAYAVRPLEKTTIGKDDMHEGYEVDVSDTILILLERLHRDPAVWKDPEAFRPERFNVENGDVIPPNAWKPFGHGQRSCIGRAFALQEAKIIISLLVRHFDVAFADDYELDTSGSLAQKPNNFRITITPRVGHPYLSPGAEVLQNKIGDIFGSTTTAAATTVEPNGEHIDIYVGSNAGICRNLGQELANKGASQGFECQVRDLDDAAANLNPEHLNLIVTSSYEGEPPDNAQEFVSWLTHTDADLSNIRYGVFGVGNIEWVATYQKVPTLIDDALAARGGQRLVERGVGDVHTDYLSPFQDWQDLLWPAVAAATGVELNVGATGSQLSVSTSEAPRTQMLKAADAPGYLNAVVHSCQRVSQDTADISSQKYSIKIGLPAGATYELGDYLDVLPQNSAAQVQRVLNRFGLAADTALTLHDAPEHLPAEQAISAWELLTNFVELAGVAGKRHIQLLAQNCPCPPEAMALEQLAAADYDVEIAAKRRSLLDLVEEYRSVNISFAEFLSALPPLLPRRYSIASSPQEDPSCVQLIFSLVQGPARSGRGEYAGVATSWMAGLEPGAQIHVAVVPGKPEFRGEADLDVPMLLIGAGSGIAPLRAFLIDRGITAAGNTAATSHLYYGCRAPEVDLLCQEEFTPLVETNVLEQHIAFSRAPEIVNDTEVHYAPQLLWEQREQVLRLLEDPRVRIFVCGSAGGFAQDTRAVLGQIAALHYGMDESEAGAALRRFEKDDQRLATDFFS